jgi:biopolymer transport protein ExbD
MTPVIDIVFLLIIFFMLVCQFISAENFQVTVPDQIDAAQSPDATDEKLTTLTVINNPDSEAVFAVGSEMFGSANSNGLTDGERLIDSKGFTDTLADAIDSRLMNLPPGQRTVNLRIDKDTPYRTSRLALEAISKSSATDIKLAATKHASKQDAKP